MACWCSLFVEVSGPLRSGATSVTDSCSHALSLSRRMMLFSFFEVRAAGGGRRGKICETAAVRFYDKDGSVLRNDGSTVFSACGFCNKHIRSAVFVALRGSVLYDRKEQHDSPSQPYSAHPSTVFRAFCIIGSSRDNAVFWVRVTRRARAARHGGAAGEGGSAFSFFASTVVTLTLTYL